MKGLIRVPSASVTDPSEMSACAQLRLQHLAHRGAAAEIGMTDDPGAQAMTERVARARQRELPCELHLAHRGHLRRTGGAVVRPAIHIDSGDDLVPAVEVREVLLRHIERPRPVPQMM